MAKNAPAPEPVTVPGTEKLIDLSSVLNQAIDPMKMEDQGKPLEEEKKAEPEAKEYVAVFGGPMHDPTTGIRFTGVPVFAAMNGWLQSQIDAGKIVEKSTEPPAE